MQQIKLIGPNHPILGKIHISGSKSISNRVLLIRALCNSSFDISNLSNSDDTQILNKLLDEDSNKFDVHHAGTSFRFLTAYLSLKGGVQILTGSDRMKQRPIAPLVDALNQIGADIEYLEKEGFPPLKINAFKEQKKTTIKIEAGISSQFISALCMIAPVLEKGLEIHLIGDIVSKPYLDMTLDIMRNFGAVSDFYFIKAVFKAIVLLQKSQMA